MIGTQTSAPEARICCPPRLRRIIKLGGAAITHKSQQETLQPDVLSSVCQSLAIDHQNEFGGTILVHGAGSFGHHPANEYGVARGPLTNPRVRHGFALTRASVTLLNGRVVSELLAVGLPAVSLSPLGHYTTCNREISTSGGSAVKSCLESGLVPVLHGDAVLDEQLGCTILSGDTIVRQLAEELRPQYVVFLTNVAGVYDRPPEEEGARLLRRIVVRKDGSWRVAEAEGGAPADIRMAVAAHDVTGGIALKVEEAARVARLGMPVLIAQAGTPHGAAACRVGPAVAAAVSRGSVGEVPSGARIAAAKVESAGEGSGEEDGGAGGRRGMARGNGVGDEGDGVWQGTLVVLEEGGQDGEE